MSLFKQIQTLIFEYLNFRPFLEELKYKMSEIKNKLDGKLGGKFLMDLGKTPLVICNINCVDYLPLDFSNKMFFDRLNYKMFFNHINPKKMVIVKGLLKKVNARRLSLGLKPNPGTYGFGGSDENAYNEFGCRLNMCYIAY